MSAHLRALDGVRVGHWTHPGRRTGCTAVLLPAGTVASVEVRGGAPASRELELLAPERTVPGVDAVVLSGGSAFGLAAAEGVVRYCAEIGRGFSTPAGAVPIVAGLSLYDLRAGETPVWPGAEAGYEAARTAVTPDGSGPAGGWPIGPIGAGVGATVGSWRLARTPSGLGSAQLRFAAADGGQAVVVALLAVNAAGDLDDTSVERSLRAGDFRPPARPPFGTSTTIGVICTNARLSKIDCLLMAQSGHDGLARTLMPAHTRFDGDALIAASVGEVEASVDAVRIAATVAVGDAVRAAVASAAGSGKDSGKPS